jgi:antitoxin (DNA-binding transcriptional repressor) of toxin-antitoxin stability system
MELDLDQARRRARELLRAARAGDPVALARMRDDRAPRLADAQRAVAADLGFRSWPALVAHVEASRADRDQRTGIVRETGLSYAPGRPIRVRVRRRGVRYDIDDMGGAVALAGRPPGWLEEADRVARARGWNVKRNGVVFVQAVEGRDIDALVRGTGEASAAVLEALFALEE